MGGIVRGREPGAILARAHQARHFHWAGLSVARLGLALFGHETAIDEDAVAVGEFERRHDEIAGSAVAPAWARERTKYHRLPRVIIDAGNVDMTIFVVAGIELRPFLCCGNLGGRRERTRLHGRD